jgi:prohibitin 2
MKPTLFGNAAVLGVVALIILALSGSIFHVVPPGARGVSVTLGKVDPIFRAEGITLKKPFIEQIFNVTTKQSTITSTATCFSSDLQTVNIQYAVLFRLPENKIVTLFQQYAGDPYSTLVEPRVQQALKEVTAGYRAEEVVKRREQLKALVLERLRTALNELIIVADLTINNVDLTHELEKAIELKQVMEQQALAKVYELQKAQREAEITVVNAKAEAEAVQIKGSALKSSPEVIQLEIVKRWDGKTPQSVVVGPGGANVLLPLR